MGVKKDMRGKYLDDIIKKFRMERLFIERGKIMVMQVNEQKYFFEVQDDYTHYPKSSTSGRIYHKGVIIAVPGTVVDGDGNIISGKDHILPDYVRFPTDSEVEWYNKIDTV